VPFDFKPWDNPYYSDVITHDQMVLKLSEFADCVGVKIDIEKCLTGDQNYFNEIHKIYELSYDGNPQWLDFHEHIHLCEKEFTKSLIIDYREKAGLLEKKFDPDWMKYTTATVYPGDVYVSWAELGKTPHRYWKNLEPNTINRMCELAKPWITLRPQLYIALEEIDFISQCNVPDFNNWWKDYQEEWCCYWNIPSWDLKDMVSVGVIGRIANIELVKSKLQQQIMPTKIQL
jgi:hypothetical protein